MDAAAAIKKEEVDVKPEEAAGTSAGPEVKAEGHDVGEKAGPSAPAAAVDMDDLLKVDR